jgi:hypothetical protein
MNWKFLITIIVVILNPFFCGYGQPKRYQVRTIAFYNLENLFDTIDDPQVFDDDFTPTGRYRWGRIRYEEKVRKLADAISGIGSELRKAPPDLLGVCEVENYSVLKDLATSSALEACGYDIIHRDSPDERGIDVALLYRKETFHPVAVKWHRLLIRNEDRFREFTRDQLVVQGYMDGVPLYLIVNHWPSRRGGELRSRGYRVAAAELNLRIIDSILHITPEPLVIGLGDFNDNPSDYSIRKVMKTTGDKKDVGDAELFNPMSALFRKGLGSLAYRDTWSLFDQIYMSGVLVKGERSLQFWKAGIYNPPDLTIRKGPFKGYPLRTYSSGRYTGGYSDHFPVYAYFIKEADPLFWDD